MKYSREDEAKEIKTESLRESSSARFIVIPHYVVAILYFPGVWAPSTILADHKTKSYHVSKPLGTRVSYQPMRRYLLHKITFVVGRDLFISLY